VSLDYKRGWLSYDDALRPVETRLPQLTQRSSFSASLDYKGCWLSYNAALESWTVSRDLGRLGRTNVDDERTLGNLLTAERDRNYVFADFLRVISACERSLVHLLILHYAAVVAMPQKFCVLLKYSQKAKWSNLDPTGKAV